MGGILTFSIEAIKNTKILEAMMNSQSNLSAGKSLVTKLMTILSLELLSSDVRI